MLKKLLKKARAKVALVLAVGMMFQGAIPAKAVVYMPDVNEDMADPEYWYSKVEEPKEKLATKNEIAELNNLTINTSGTNMYDLKAMSETFDGKKLNESLKSAVKNELEGKIGKWYNAENETISAEYIEDIIENVDNVDAVENQEIKYGIVVNPSTLRAYPTDKMLLDDPGDYDFDNLYLSGVRVNEPLVIKSVSYLKDYYYAYSTCVSGWISAEDVAICKDRDEWLSAWDIDEDNKLVVYDNKMYTEESNTYPETSNRMLTMGTYLEMVPDDEIEIVDTGDIPSARGVVVGTNRAAYNNYVVYMPVRKADGSYEKKITHISQGAGVHAGYYKLTVKKIMDIAFECLGDTYGWGGMLNADDCSEYMRNVYACFGLDLPRNTTWQQKMPVKKYTFIVPGADATEEEVEANLELKKRALDTLKPGAILYFSGHEMMYLGSDNGKYYVISSTSTIMNPYMEGTRQRARGVIINTLDTKRANGNTWLKSLITMAIPYAVGANNEAEIMEVPEATTIPVETASEETSQVTTEASAEVTSEVTAEASAEVSAAPTSEATAEASAEVSAAPTSEATAEASAEVSAAPTSEATAEASAEVSAAPTSEATAEASAEVSAAPTSEATAEASAEVSAEPTSEATATANAIATLAPTNMSSSASTVTSTSSVKNGDLFKVGNYQYKIKSTSAKTVILTKELKAKKVITVPKTVKIKSINYKVVEIGKKAFYKNNKCKIIKIKGANLISIKNPIFNKKKLKKTKIKKVKLKCGKKQKKKYLKLFKKEMIKVAYKK